MSVDWLNIIPNRDHLDPMLRAPFLIEVDFDHYLACATDGHILVALDEPGDFPKYQGERLEIKSNMDGGFALNTRLTARLLESEAYYRKATEMAVT
jgi:hypothetical protein